MRYYSLFVMSICIISLCVLGSLARLNAATYYVSGTGDNANDGQSATVTGGHGPFLTIQKAADLLNAGDTVLVLNGTYRNTGRNSAVWLSHSGTADGWITFRAYPGHHPRIEFNGSGGFDSWGVSYIEIDGFDIVGNNDHVTLDQALQQVNPTGDWTPEYRFNGNGISFDGRQATGHPHHLRIRNNSVSKCGGGGISIIQADYVTIEDNRVFANSWYTVWATSGISTWENWNSDNNTGTKMIIRRNIVYNNRTLVPWIVTKAPSDGNGIIIDDLKNTQGSTLSAYTGRTLVENNLSFDNGGMGIHVFMSEHVDVINNSTWHNAQILTDYVELSANSANDVLFRNNIAVAESGKKVNESLASTNIAFDHNLYFGSARIGVIGDHDVVADPFYVHATTDQATFDFHLLPGSPAIDSGATAMAPIVDLDGHPRPAGSGIDRGAYDRAAPDTTPPATPTAPITNNTTSATPTLSGITEPGATVTIFDSTAILSAAILGTAIADSSGHWSFAVPTLAPGTHALSVTATDASHNSSANSPATVITVAETNSQNSGGVATIPAPATSSTKKRCGAGAGIAALAALFTVGMRRVRICGW